MTEETAVDRMDSNLFISGWRPTIGWICAAGFLLQLIVVPLFDWLMTLVGSSIRLPSLDTSTLMALLFAMLGLGSLRTMEKIQGVQK